MLLFEPETLRQKYPSFSEEDINRLQAIFTIKNSNGVYEDFYVFENAVWALNGVIPDVDTFTPPPVPWIWYGLKLIKEYRPEMEFSEEIKKYIIIVSNSQGYAFYPPEIKYTDIYEEISKMIAAYEELDAAFGETEIEIQAAKLLEINAYITRMSEK